MVLVDFFTTLFFVTILAITFTFTNPNFLSKAQHYNLTYFSQVLIAKFEKAIQLQVPTQCSHLIGVDLKK